MKYEDIMETADKARAAHKRKQQRKSQQERVRNLSRDDFLARKDLLLWHKLHKIFTQKEYVSYEDLPDALKNQVNHFDEFVFPYNSEKHDQ